MTSTYTDYQIIARDVPKALSRKATEAQVARDLKYFTDHIGGIKTVDDFLGNTRLFDFAMQAFGLADMAYAKGFMRKILAGEPDANGQLLVDRIQDERFRAFAKAFDFRTLGAETTQRSEASTAVVDAYVRQKLESDAGDQDEGVRLALYFKRQAGTITSAYGILADKALGVVVRTTLGLADETARGSLDAQAALITSKVDLASFRDPDKLDRFIKRFTLRWDMKNNATSAPLLSLFGGADGGFDTGVLLKLQSIRLGGH
ncbi:hypothetical protein ASG32_19465 [Methylobacterium sp. Leaf361]|uniref:DUF1217 domain-containing protein n=1 Tax=Methylobacterium sp. Leaf361 TaxID=1736352 RepID=UPI0006F2586B|nr:DUF1217 domain-containing protein [Methylobacterium sp. Leaf361]KQS84900.1 hypothetical protein ASG32_19465 [Methylobacterium sp. Leaf361]